MSNITNVLAKHIILVFSMFQIGNVICMYLPDIMFIFASTEWNGRNVTSTLKNCIVGMYILFLIIK